AGGSGGAGSSGGAGRSGGTGGNAGRTGVRDAGPTVPELTGTKAMGIEAPNNTPWSEVRKWMTEEFCHQSVIQRLEQELYNLRMKGMDIDGNGLCLKLPKSAKKPDNIYTRSKTTRQSRIKKQFFIK
nr:hypothetical protein [Tanacetum cinerariifolium]